MDKVEPSHKPALCVSNVEISFVVNQQTQRDKPPAKISSPADDFRHNFAAAAYHGTSGTTPATWPLAECPHVSAVGRDPCSNHFPKTKPATALVVERK